MLESLHCVLRSPGIAHLQVLLPFQLCNENNPENINWIFNIDVHIIQKDNFAHDNISRIFKARKTIIQKLIFRKMIKNETLIYS